MAQDLEKLVVQLSADISKYERAMTRASNVGNKQLASIERRAVSMNKNLAGSFTALGANLGLALGAAFSVKGLSELQDSYTKIQNSLKVAGLSGKELTDVYNQLYASAQKNAAPIESLATLYSRVAINQKELGVSSQQVVGLTNSVAMALNAQGSGAQEAQGALLQLSQALGSGKVQAEEWGSLVDGLPVLLQAAATGIKQAGGSVSKLTQLVKSGQLSNKALFDGIAAGTPVIEEKLAGASETAGQAITALRNALTNAAGKLGEASGASKLFGEVVGGVVSYLDGVSFDNFITGINNVVTALDSGISKFTTFLAQAGKAAGIQAPNVMAGIEKTSPSSDKEVYDFYYGGGKERLEAENNAKRRLEIEKQIADLKASPTAAKQVVDDQIAALNAELDARRQVRQEQAASGPGAIRKPVQGLNRTGFAGGSNF